MDDILIAISAGELIDRISILELKSERILDREKRVAIVKELDETTLVRDTHLEITPALQTLSEALKSVNTALWDAEDAIRSCEREEIFDDRFIKLARSIYILNDQRAALKREINILLSSPHIEEKSYTTY